MKENDMAMSRQATQKQLNKINKQSDESAGSVGEGSTKSSLAGLGMLAQARMEVGRADDPAEVEADAMALDFLRWQQSSGEQSAPAQQQVSSEQTSRSTSGGTMETGGFAVGGGLESEIARETGRGSGLDGSTRGQFEGFFGVDLGGVRLHADSKAAELSRSLGAEAFTVGNDVFFGEGRFASGSSAGMGLLAHELTHVVQQGGSSMRRVDPNAVSLSRSPLAGTQMIRRVDISDSSTLEGGAFDMTEKVSGGGSMAASLRNWNEVDGNFVAADGNPEGVTDEGLGLLSSTLNTISAIDSLWEAFNEPSTTEEKGWVVFGALKAALDLSKSACEAAKAVSTLAGGALAVIPGLGLAVSVMSFADTLLNTLQPLWAVRKSENKALETLRGKVAGTTDPAAKKALALRIASMETLVTTSGRQIGFAIVDMTADLVMIVGQIATLAAGPFGTAVTLLGVTLSLAGLATRKVWTWVTSHKAANLKVAESAAKTGLEESQANYDAASAKATAAGATDKDRDDLTAATTELKEKEDAYDNAYMALVSTDANAAFKNIIDMAFAPLRATPPQAVDVATMELLKEHGVSEKFINATSAEITANPTATIDYEIAVEEAAGLVAVGPPINMMDRVASWGKTITKAFGRTMSWFKRQIFGHDSLAVSIVTPKFVDAEATAMTSVLGKYVKKKASQGENGVKPDRVNEYLQKPYKNFVGRVMSGATDQAEKARRLEYIVQSSERAVRAALAGAIAGGAPIDMGTVQVIATEASISVGFTVNAGKMTGTSKGTSAGTINVVNPMNAAGGLSQKAGPPGTVTI